MKSLMIAVAVVCAAAAPSYASKGVKNIDVVGCVKAGPNGYQLQAQSKKGNARQYDLSGNHDFKTEVGHRMRIVGTKDAKTVKVRSASEVASSCS